MQGRGILLCAAAAVFAAVLMAPSADAATAPATSMSSFLQWAKSKFSADSETPLERRLRMLDTEIQWKNDIVLCLFVSEANRDALREYSPLLLSWLRNYVAGMLLYFGVGGLWAAYCYWWDVKRLYAPGAVPGRGDIYKQIVVSAKAIPLYTLLPAVTEHAIVRGWTLAYASIDEVGYLKYFVYFWAYMLVVEFGVYWCHRLLHDIKPLYKHLHRIHHIYNKEHTMSPFAGLAFHPIDGIIQAAPYVVALFLVPMHFFTHEILLFKTAVWTTSIHDNVDGHLEPVMGAGYHTVHHTLYKVNYGHYTTYMDQLFGTAKVPTENAKKGKN